MARRPEMISKSWLFLELSIYSDRVAKKGETLSPPSTPSFLVLKTPAGSEPYDLRVHNRGCKTILFVVSGSTGLGLVIDTWTGAFCSLDRTAGLGAFSLQWVTRAVDAMKYVRERFQESWGLWALVFPRKNLRVPDLKMPKESCSGTRMWGLLDTCQMLYSLMVFIDSEGVVKLRMATEQSF